MNKKWDRRYVCTKCGHKIEESSASAWRRCPKCDERMYDTDATPHRVIDTPIKGSKRYYKEKWFRRSEQEWHKDIKSRRVGTDGQVIRVNNKGERTQ